jgi:hypothetical protein
METAIKHKPGKYRDFVLQRYLTLLSSKCPAKLLDQPRQLMFPAYIYVATTGRSHFM